MMSRRWCNGGMYIAEVEGMATACSLEVVLVPRAAWSAEPDDGWGGRSGGLILETKPSACCSSHLMNWDPGTYILVSERPSFNSVTILFLCFKQNQTNRLISVSMKVPDMT